MLKNDMLNTQCIYMYIYADHIFELVKLCLLACYACAWDVKRGFANTPLILI